MKRWRFVHNGRTFYVYDKNSVSALNRICLTITGVIVGPFPAGLWNRKKCIIEDDPEPGQVLVDHHPPSRKR